MKLSVWLQVLKSHGLISNDKKADRMMQKQLDFDQSRSIAMEALHRLVDEMEHNEQPGKYFSQMSSLPMNVIALSVQMKRDGEAFWSEYQTALLRWPQIIRFEVGLSKVAYALSNVNINTVVSRPVIDLVLQNGVSLIRKMNDIDL